MAAHFVPRLTADALPRPGAADAIEGQVLDFKEWHHGIQPAPLELAKDVAAFANASGGTIVFGATESDHRLARYEGNDAAAAAKLCDTLHDVVHKRLRPPPVVVPRAIELDGTCVVALNVYPYVGQAVGVRVKQTECGDAEHTKNVDAYLFPVRVGEDTIWLNPEQTAMLMIPEVRRAVSMLRQIKENEWVHVEYRPRGVLYAKSGIHTIDAVDELRNAVRLVGQAADGTQGRTVPVDAISCVYFDEGFSAGGRWVIVVELNRFVPV